MRWQLLKKASGYKPFLYDVSLDLCDYLEKRNHPFINIIFNTFTNASSGGPQRCPLKVSKANACNTFAVNSVDKLIAHSLQDELTLEHFRFPVNALKMLPLPMGEYAVFATLSTEGVERAETKVYFVLAEF